MSNIFNIDEEEDENYLGEEVEETFDESEADIGEDVRPLPKKFASTNQANRRLRVRPMTRRMAESHPNIVSLLMTRDDGRQLMFVRK